MVLKKCNEFNIVCKNLVDWYVIAHRLNTIRDMYYESDKELYNNTIEISIPMLEQKYNCKIKLEG